MHRRYDNIYVVMLIQDEVLQLKRIASRNAKEIKKFWIKINKVISFKQKLDADAVKQKVVEEQ